MSKSLPGEETDVSSSGEDISSSVECPDCGKKYANTDGIRYHLNSNNVDCEGCDCPSCSRSFVNQKGMRNHHAITHGESLRKVVVECATCGVKFEKEPHHIENTNTHYCSHDCQGEALKKRVEKECEECGETYTTWPYAKERSKYCSSKCQAESMVLPGERDGYGVGWTEIRQKVRNRDNYRCQGCGTHEDKLARQLHVHHIRPIREFDQPENANTLLNLVSLCSSCHRKWEGIGLRPILLCSPNFR